jgi:hypothetical protein
MNLTEACQMVDISQSQREKVHINLVVAELQSKNGRSEVPISTNASHCDSQYRRFTITVKV